MTTDDSHSTIVEAFIHTTDDIDTLRRLLIDKERERACLANDLNVAARLGLVISETNEALHSKLEKVQQENRALQQQWATPREQLALELDLAKRDLDAFRQEMDGLTGQLIDMSTEMVESKTRVSVYAKRLANVEHKLTTTRQMNHQLQSLLEKTLQSQKQSSSTTTHLVKNLQDDLAKVVAENNQLHNRIIELEQQQIQGEDRLCEMAIQAQDYADLLEQAQTTIDQLSQIEEDDLSSLSSSTTEIKKGAVFSIEFRQEMQKEIERTLQLRHDTKHHQPMEKQGLLALIADRRSSELHRRATATPMLLPINTLRPERFLTGFAHDHPFKRPSFLAHASITRPRDPNNELLNNPNGSSLSTRFFHRLASRFDNS